MFDFIALLKAFARTIDQINRFIGQAISWLLVLMVAISFFILLLRYLAGWGAVWLQELVLWMHAIVILGVAAHTFGQGKHIRIDVLYRERSIKYRAVVDLLGSLVLLLPMVIAIAIASWPYVLRSWKTLESSGEAGGLWGLFLLKSFILLFCLTLALQALAITARSYLQLVKNKSGPLTTGNRS